MTLEVDSTSSSATEKLGEKLGRQLRGGEVIELVSDLGGGKTTFVRGLANGMGSTDHVSSPTFKISNIYRTSGKRNISGQNLRSDAQRMSNTSLLRSSILTKTAPFSGSSEEQKKQLLELHHFDFYRLNEAGIIANELAEVVGQSDVVTVVEWGSVVKNVLPNDRLSINFMTTDEATRHITFIYPEQLAYLVKGDN